MLLYGHGLFAVSSFYLLKKNFFHFPISKDTVGKLLDTVIVHNNWMRETAKERK